MKYIRKVVTIIGLKKAYLKIQDLLLKSMGFVLLTQEQTSSFMRPYEKMVIPANRSFNPEAKNCADNEILFPAGETITDEQYVWEYKNSTQKALVSKYGSVIIGRHVLCTDRTHSSFYKDIRSKDKRPVKSVPVLIAPFSHFQDEKGFAGYFDFVFSIALKIARIKDAFPDEDLSDAVISYPLLNTSYETEYLELLGFKRENLIDSREFNVISSRILTGNSRNWHPNLSDILSIKRQIEQKITPVKSESNRIYISRSGRRSIVNEDELIAMLKKFDFLIIEDKPRSVAEQISIYHNASFIIGPHGASFGNIIWCEPGTHLLELFSPNYTPDFFVYLASVMNMQYTAYFNGAADNKVNYMDGLFENIYVSVPELEISLSNILQKQILNTKGNVS